MRLDRLYSNLQSISLERRSEENTLTPIRLPQQGVGALAHITAHSSGAENKSYAEERRESIRKGARRSKKRMPGRPSRFL
jgi:hypothetical protein